LKKESKGLSQEEMNHMAVSFGGGGGAAPSECPMHAAPTSAPAGASECPMNQASPAAENDINPLNMVGNW